MLHHLLTATVVVRGGETVWQHLSIPRLVMRTLKDGDIDTYLARIGPLALESVGAYQLEGRGATLFTEVDGDFFYHSGLAIAATIGFLEGQQLVG